MTTIEIENPAVSVQFGPYEQLTVPEGYVWRVNVSSATAVRNVDSSGTEVYAFNVNGETVASNEGGVRNSNWGRSYHACSTLPIENAVFVGGDTLTAVEGEIHLNGYVVGVMESEETLGDDDDTVSLSGESSEN